MVARTKSFTGCWTCRARKIKCDLGEPSCQQCLRSKVNCEGYTIRLCWAGKDKSEFRRNLEPVKFPPDSMYDTYEDMDDVLDELDSMSPQTETCKLGPFSVFRGTADPMVDQINLAKKSRRRASKVIGTPTMQRYSPRGVHSTPSIPNSNTMLGSGLNSINGGSELLDGIFMSDSSTMAKGNHRESTISPSPSGGANGANGLNGSNGSNRTNRSNGSNASNGSHGLNGLNGSNEPVSVEEPSTSVESNGQTIIGNEIARVNVSGSTNKDMYPQTGLDFAIQAMADNGPLLTSPPYDFDPGRLLFGLEDDYLFDMLPESFTHAPENLSSYTNALDLLFEKQPPQYVPYLPMNNTSSTHYGSARLTALGQCLISNYYEQLVPYMSVVKHPQNIWQTLYTPRAVSAIGDIISTGRTTAVRYTILHAVTAASAYHLLHGFQQGSLGYAYYSDLGQRLHDASRMWLSRCFQRQKNIGKYKDFLVALSSLMVTEFIRGDSTGSDMAIVATQRLVNLRLARRPNVSRKAMMLHRTCAMSILFSRAATSPDTPKDSENPLDNDKWLDTVFAEMSPKQSNAQQHMLEGLEQLESRQRSLSYMENPSELEDYFRQYDVDVADEDAAASMELMYGLPSSLAYLFKESVKISRQALREREERKNAQYSGNTTQMPDQIPNNDYFGAELASQCTALEAQLVNWRHQYRPPDIDYKRLTCNDEAGKKARWSAVILHHTMAFYSALILYHYRVAKDVNPDLLQSYVERIIDHLETIMQLNQQHGSTIAIPFSFTGFVGACEVSLSDPNLRARYDKWFQAMQASCLSSYGPQVEIIAEIYRRRQMGQSCDWWNLIKERPISLNLH